MTPQQRHQKQIRDRKARKARAEAKRPRTITLAELDALRSTPKPVAPARKPMTPEEAAAIDASLARENEFFKNHFFPSN